MGEIKIYKEVPTREEFTVVKRTVKDLDNELRQYMAFSHKLEKKVAKLEKHVKKLKEKQ